MFFDVYKLYRIKVCVWSSRVKDLIAIHHRDQVLCFGQVDDVMRIAGKHVDALDIVARDLKLDHLAFRVVEVALLDEAVTTDHDKELPLGIVPMLPLGDARLADVDGDLTTVEGMHQLGEGAAGVHIHLQREGDFLLGKIREIRGVKLLSETAVRNLWNGQRLGLFGETVE